MSDDDFSLENLGLTRRNILKTTGVVGVSSSVFAATAAARNPHCIRRQTFAEGPDALGDLEVCFKVAGLGNEDVLVTTTATAVACYACKNNGGNYPQDPKKQQEEAEVQNSVRITPENGNVQDCLLLEEPPTTLDCPGNQTATLVSVTYSNIRIVTTDYESGEVLARCRIRGNFSRTFEEEARAQCD